MQVKRRSVAASLDPTTCGEINITGSQGEEVRLKGEEVRLKGEEGYNRIPGRGGEIT